MNVRWEVEHAERVQLPLRRASVAEDLVSKVPERRVESILQESEFPNEVGPQRFQR